MNAYSYMLIKNPDVNFEGINIKDYKDLPGEILQDQKMQEDMLLHGIQK